MLAKHKKIIGIAVIGVITVGFFVHLFSPRSAKSIFREHLVRPIPKSVKYLEAAAAGFNYDWDAHMSFSIAPEDLPTLLTAHNLQPTPKSSNAWTHYTNNFQWFYEQKGRIRINNPDDSEFYSAFENKGDITTIYYLLADKRHEKIFFTKYMVF